MIDEGYIGSYKFHDVAVATNPSQVYSFVGLGSPPPRADRPAKARRHGNHELTAYYDPRILQAKGYLFNLDGDWAAFWDTVDDFKQAIGMGTGSQVLKFKRAGLSFYEFVTVVPAGELNIDLEAIYGDYTAWDIQWVAADPRMYEYTPSTDGEGVVTAGGNFSTPPILTIEGCAASNTIRNDTTGHDIKTTGCDPGADIVIDVEARTIKQDGVLHPELIDVANTYWWYLRSGTNDVQLTGAGTLTVDWNNARI